MVAADEFQGKGDGCRLAHESDPGEDEVHACDVEVTTLEPVEDSGLLVGAGIDGWLEGQIGTLVDVSDAGGQR